MTARIKIVPPISFDYCVRSVKMRVFLRPFYAVVMRSKESREMNKARHPTRKTEPLSPSQTVETRPCALLLLLRIGVGYRLSCSADQYQPPDPIVAN
jgi:hypothetical protein